MGIIICGLNGAGKSTLGLYGLTERSLLMRIQILLWKAYKIKIALLRKWRIENDL